MQLGDNVLAHARREHRWVRGDWQILAWLLPMVPTPNGFAKNRLSLISQWKILDNLRRSLVAPSLLALFAAAWTVLPGNPLAWTLAGLSVVSFPLVTSLFHLLKRPPAYEPARVHLHGLLAELSTASAQAFLTLVFLPYHAWEMAHAIALTLVRLVITQRRLLDWETAAAQAARAALARRPRYAGGTGGKIAARSGNFRKSRLRRGDPGHPQQPPPQRWDALGRRQWHRRCLACLTCEMKCPAEAIRSALSRPFPGMLLRSVFRYNVRRWVREGELEYVRMVHRRGVTHRIGATGNDQPA